MNSMKKQMHILEGIMILIIVFIAFLLLSWFIYKVNHEKIDTTYIWNVKFDNLNIKDGSKGSVTYTNESLVVDVILKEFDEFMEFSIDVINYGSIDAILDSYELDVNNMREILKYSVTYLDGKEVKEGDIIGSNDKKTLVVKIFYPPQETKIYLALELKLSLNMHFIAYQ